MLVIDQLEQYIKYIYVYAKTCCKDNNYEG